ncbi:unnamed protein product [Paramecium primaurelia]|uniref:Uncharacterized protein n=1 Tax=Paramecium primaurelia TaxID=5886 RepID=A0A8S1LQR7_PARPR|nr:unnamed protein product [Paramecium primaurelia]
MNPNYNEILKQIMDFKQEGIRTLISGLLVKLIIGLFFAWPILQSYHEILIGYKDLNHQYILYISYALMILIMNLFIPHTDFFLKKLGPQTLICLFVCLIGMSFMLIAIFDQNWVIHLLLQLLIIAPSVGILYSTPFLISWRYFVKQKQHLNAMFQIFIGQGAFLALRIFESNQANQLKLYFDNEQYFCGECFNLQTRQSLRSLTIWVFILGIVAALLVKQLDGDLADSVVDYDLLAFVHLDLQQQQDSRHSQNDSDQSLDQSITFTQSLSTKPFQIMSILVVSSSLLPYLIFCQYQRIQSALGISYTQSSVSFLISILLYGFMRQVYNYFISDWPYKLVVKGLVQMNMLLILIFIASLWFQNTLLINIMCSIYVVSIAILFSVISNSIPKIFGSMASQGVFSFMLTLMGLSAVISNSISYFFPQETIKNMLFYFSIIVFLCQIVVYRIAN